MDLTASVPSFEARTGMWAVALALISIPSAFPVIVRILGGIAAVMLAVTAGQIFAGVQILLTSSPMPFYAYPFFVATFFGWIWTLFKIDATQISRIKHLLPFTLRKILPEVISAATVH
jgi:hypothetical protein